MAVNLINSSDIEVSQTGDNIELNTSISIATLDSKIETNITNISNNTTAITNLKTYSTSETLTNKVWIDNKPIYRKVLSGTTSTTNTEFQIAHGISNYDIIMIDNKSFVKSVGSSTLITPINCPSNTTSDYANRPVRARIVDGNILLYIGNYNGYSSYEYAIILEYTKTS